VFFRLFDRIPISRDRDWWDLTEISENQAAARILADAMIWTISEHGGPVQAANDVKSYNTIKGFVNYNIRWALGNHSSLGDCMFKIQHINEEENELISGTREKSAVGDSAEPKQ
jgi:hypothetical protein